LVLDEGHHLLGAERSQLETHNLLSKNGKL
jgi:hypothetical protein